MELGAQVRGPKLRKHVRASPYMLKINTISKVQKKIVVLK